MEARQRHTLHHVGRRLGHKSQTFTADRVGQLQARGVQALADRVVVTWADQRVSPFHHQWLRDNCPCTQCVYTVTREQVLEIVDVDQNLTAANAHIDELGCLSVEWQDGHQSIFDPGWLRAHAYDDDSRAERLADKPTARLWRNDLQLPVFEYAALMNDNAALLQWLIAVRDIGLTQVRGVPTEPGSLKLIAQRISFIRESNFGVLFNVQSKADADSNAYTAFNLPLHTDLPTRELQPGLQFLHCLVNDAEGGESIFVDGFAIADALRSEDPEAFQALCEIPVEFRNKDRHSDYRCLAPIIGATANAMRGEEELCLAAGMNRCLVKPFALQALFNCLAPYQGITREAL